MPANRRLLAWLTCLAAIGLTPKMPAAEPAKTPDAAALRHEFAGLLTDLDNDRYAEREQAAARVEKLLQQPALRPLLGAEIQQALLRPELSFEVRSRLERWRTKLPKVEPPPPEHVSPAEVDRLIGQLDDDEYGVRIGAAERLDWLLRNPRLIWPALTALKAHLAALALAPDTAARYEKAWESAHRAWLLCDAAQRDAPPPADATIAAWIGQLTVPGRGEAATSAASPQRAAERELLDALGRDADVPRLTTALRAKLAGRLAPDAAARVQRLLDLTQPAMVAEFWSGRQQLGVQHLLVGVPSMPPGARRPSFFDRIDDRVAHCVSGSTLSPGDYPTGVAFPHPTREDEFLDLVNLPTPRRRMAYTYQLQIDEAKRLAAISRRTLDRLLAEKRPLTEAELVMLAQLDANEVSRFAGPCLKLIDDRLLDGPMTRERLGGRPSHHGMICGQLAVDGTQEAAAGLLEAIAKDRFLPPTSAAPYRMQWLAALAIARRDPWRDVDAWLAAQVENSQRLVEDQRPDAPEVGATAAALLLKRHSQPSAQFGLQTVPDAVLLDLGIEGRRFTTPESRRAVQQWWKQQSDQRKPL